MSDVENYLTKQIYIEKNVVTFRSLSRQFGLHVNEAKNRLASFHANAVNAETRSFATYLVSGELFPSSRAEKPNTTQTDDGMDVDVEETAGVEELDDEEIPQTVMTLVGEDSLEYAKGRYARIFATHIYCLSPSPLTDAGLICEPSAIVYQADAKNAPASSVALGRVVGPDVKIGKPPPPVASSSKAGQPVSRQPTLKVKDEEPSKPAKKDKSTVIKPKASASGKLDWSKAKKPDDKSKGNTPKEEVKKEKSESPAPKLKVKDKASTKDETPKDDNKRGTKRKAATKVASDSEEEPASVPVKKQPSPPAKSEVKVRKNRIVSDDEDDDAPPPTMSKSKLKLSKTERLLGDNHERSLRAMMDIDDSLVEMASNKRPQPKEQPKDEDVEMEEHPDPEPEKPMEADVDVEMDEPKAKPRKKKEKKVIPIGSNGLKKKRVVKSRMKMDEKGYMVTEDYSSYESADEDEDEAPKKSKATKAASTTKSKVKKEEDDGSKASKPARSGSIKAKTGSVKGQGSLKGYFETKPKK
ncbi:DNA polymerase subunit Cdc27 [Epithele typhae]|uniref:DNA polymerase subunit Cdc27 n=1 Tax=Epithele typhae TaxID=378194 RepID=UPI0020080C13|nr:DNA polymerase subunit Cdc27 [Epithele typhae]KAH9943385.1 DNA polymerase subunit Cdc27 [Epithele typhae]